MKIISLAGAARFLTIAGVLVLSTTVADAHECSKHKNPNHKHCDTQPPPASDRISGCVTFASGPITTDGGGTYCDGNPVTDHLNKADFMQVAMNCSANHFNVYPGGGNRRVRLDIFPNSIETAITSCDASLPITFFDTDMSDLAQNCTNTDPDWGFQQLMRTSASSGDNVCALGFGDIQTATMRFQNNMYHIKTCKGGAKKCGVSLEAMEVNYDGDGSSDEVTITCTAFDSGANQCTQWNVANGSGNGWLTHGSGGAPTLEPLPFSIDFVAN